MIAYLEAETGGDIVRGLLEDVDARCYAHAVNVAEVHYHVMRRSDEVTADASIETLIADGIVVREDMDTAFWKSISRLKARGRLSIADCFCIALAQRLSGEVVTTDHHEFDVLVPLGLCPIRFIR